MNEISIFLRSWFPTAVVLTIYAIPIAFGIWIFRSLRRIENKIDAIERRISNL
jgi:hypothetical protein